MTTDLVRSTFQNKPAYRYIRASDALPSIDAARDEAVPLARIKLFDPTGSWTWYVNSYDPETGQAYGLVDGHERELGYFDMRELAEFRGQFKLPLERDLHWKPKPLSELL